MTIDEATRRLLSALSGIYDERESGAITSLVMEKLTGFTRSERIISKHQILSDEQISLFTRYLEDLTRHRPVQYVLNEAWFSGLKFFVDERVLIPRPETEELVNWVLEDLPSPLSSGFKLLDIGTGSGCIPVSIACKRKDLDILACDISTDALDVASKNASDLQARVQFFSFDIRDRSSWQNVPEINFIVSNPPYIPETQRDHLDFHVRFFEPEQALFAPAGDPILFYRLIGEFAKARLAAGGKVYLELHHDFASETMTWFKHNGFSTEIRRDVSGKNRMLCVQPLLLRS